MVKTKICEGVRLLVITLLLPFTTMAQMHSSLEWWEFIQNQDKIAEQQQIRQHLLDVEQQQKEILKNTENLLDTLKHFSYTVKYHYSVNVKDVSSIEVTWKELKNQMKKFEKENNIKNDK